MSKINTVGNDGGNNGYRRQFDPTYTQSSFADGTFLYVPEGWRQAAITNNNYTCI